MKAPYLKNILAEFKPYRGSIALVLFLGLIISAIQPLCLKITQQIIDALSQPDSSGPFKNLSYWLIGIFLVSGLTKYFYNTIRRYITEKVILKLRAKLFDKILKLPQATLDQRKGGDFMSILQYDLQQVSVGAETVCDMLKEPFVFLGLLGTAIYKDPVLAAFTLVVAPLVVFLFSYTGKAVKKYAHLNTHQFSEMMSLSQEAISGNRVIKLFHLEHEKGNQFRQVQQEFFHVLFRSIKIQELATPSVEFVGACLMVAVMMVGQYRISQGALTTGGLIAFVLALGLAQMPIKKLNNAFLKLKNGEAAAQRIYGLLQEPELSDAGTIKPNSLAQAIEFKNVSFGYSPSRLALSSISLTIPKGKVIALVGPSGSGKSTLAQLIPRLYDSELGEILWDGVSLKHISLFTLRRLVSVVSQDTFLFHDTLFNNIRYGNLEAERSSVIQAAEQAGCLPFIERANHQFETLIGDRGVLLSGGERQRIAIARAFLKNAPLLILDEATSNLDTQSEKLIQQSLEKLMVGKTTLVIAHRLSTVEKADCIYVLDSGRVIEAGPHQELMAKQNLYFKLSHQLS